VLPTENFPHENSHKASPDFTLNIEAKRQGNEPPATVKTQTSTHIATIRCSEGVEAQTKEFCTLTLDERER